jgi:hypothetical protein
MDKDKVILENYYCCQLRKQMFLNFFSRLIHLEHRIAVVFLCFMAA